MPETRDSVTAPRDIRIRTCIVSRERRPDTELLRVALDPQDPTHSTALADPARRLPGRGAWIAPDLAVLELAEQRHAFRRAFRVSTTVDTGHVRKYLAAHAAGPDIVRKTEH